MRMIAMPQKSWNVKCQNGIYLISLHWNGQIWDQIWVLVSHHLSLILYLKEQAYSFTINFYYPVYLLPCKISSVCLLQQNKLNAGIFWSSFFNMFFWLGFYALIAVAAAKSGWSPQWQFTSQMKMFHKNNGDSF